MERTDDQRRHELNNTFMKFGGALHAIAESEPGSVSAWIRREGDLWAAYVELSRVMMQRNKNHRLFRELDEAWGEHAPGASA